MGYRYAIVLSSSSGRASMIDGSTQFNDGWDLFKQSLKALRKHPAFIVPIMMVWLLYAPLVLVTKYRIPWHRLSAQQSLVVLFLILFAFSWIILAGCSVMLELIRQLEFGQELSVTRAFGRMVEKDLLRIVPLAFVWAIVWFILTVIQALLSHGKRSQNNNDEPMTLENSAKTLADYQSFSWSGLTIELLQKGARMVVFLILPAIVWEELGFTDAVKKGMVALKAQIKGFAAGYALTYATAALVFLPPFVVIRMGSSDHGTPPLFHYPPWVWAAVIYYVGLAWSFCMYLEQMLWRAYTTFR